MEEYSDLESQGRIVGLPAPASIQWRLKVRVWAKELEASREGEISLGTVSLGIASSATQGVLAWTTRG